MPNENPHAARSNLLWMPHPLRQHSQAMRFSAGTEPIATHWSTLPVRSPPNASEQMPVHISIITEAAGNATQKMNVVTGCDNPLPKRVKNPILFSVFSMARIIPKIPIPRIAIQWRRHSSSAIHRTFYRRRWLSRRRPRCCRPCRWSPSPGKARSSARSAPGRSRVSTQEARAPP